jgi:hypothetical protein
LLLHGLSHVPNASINLALHKTLITVVRVFSWPRELGWIV